MILPQDTDAALTGGVFFADIDRAPSGEVAGDAQCCPGIPWIPPDPHTDPWWIPVELGLPLWAAAPGSRRARRGGRPGNGPDRGHPGWVAEYQHERVPGARIEQLLEIDRRRLCIQHVAEPAPAIPEFRRAGVVGEGRRIEELSMHAPENIAERDLRRWTRKPVAALLASLALHDLAGLQLDQNLHQIVGRDAVLRGDLFDAGGVVLAMAARQRKHGARGIVAFDGQFQGRAVCRRTAQADKG